MSFPGDARRDDDNDDVAPFGWQTVEPPGLEANAQPEPAIARDVAPADLEGPAADFRELLHRFNPPVAAAPPPSPAPAPETAPTPAPETRGPLWSPEVTTSPDITARSDHEPWEDLAPNPAGAEPAPAAPTPVERAAVEPEPVEPAEPAEPDVADIVPARATVLTEPGPRRRLRSLAKLVVVVLLAGVTLAAAIGLAVVVITFALRRAVGG